jgi:hypothetical protein
MRKLSGSFMYVIVRHKSYQFVFGKETKNKLKTTKNLFSIIVFFVTHFILQSKFLPFQQATA